MNTVQSALSAATLVVIPAVLAGIHARRLWPAARLFPAYLLAVWVTEFLIFFWPARFYTWDFWIGKELLVGLLKLALAAEIILRAFAAFPGARLAARRSFVVVAMVLALILVWVLRQPSPSQPQLAQALVATLANGTAVAFVMTWALVFWYHVPLHPLHKAILGGLAGYLLVFTFGARLLIHLGFASRPVAAALDGSAYVALLLLWTWVAWRRPIEPTTDEDLLRRLQPWRDSL